MQNIEYPIRISNVEGDLGYTTGVKAQFGAKMQYRF
jgi:hypothetical protein